jgi:hypothetical protein
MQRISLIAGLAGSLALAQAVWAQNSSSPGSSLSAPLGSPTISRPRSPLDLPSQTSQVAGTHKPPKQVKTAPDTTAMDPAEIDQQEDRVLNEKLNSICRGC